jgi:ribosomal-protein-alanine N-acetyltransferase
MAQLRLATTDTADINPIVDIDRRSFAWPWNHTYFTGELACRQGCNFTLKAVNRENTQKVIGYIICRLVQKELHILRMAVKPNWRGHGLAARMLDRALGRAAKKGAGSAFLEVRPSNQSALALYNKQGFRMIGKKPYYYTDTREDALVLMKNLKEDL